MKPLLTSSQNQINLQERIVTYKIVLSNRAKYLRLQINNSNELEVVLPRRYRHEKIEDFIVQKKEWILKHLKEKKKQESLFLGEAVNIIMNYDLFLKKPRIVYQDKKIIASIPADNNSFTQEDIYNTWLKHKAKIFIPQRVKELAERTGFNYKRITIRSQKTRWGSCTTSGSLSFNFKLMRFKKQIIDYVIIHELCHLKEMNHSKRFWKLVEKFCPDYKILKKELRNMNK